LVPKSKAFQQGFYAFGKIKKPGGAAALLGINPSALRGTTDIWAYLTRNKESTDRSLYILQ
jgi:hypothetical protein